MKYQKEVRLFGQKVTLSARRWQDDIADTRLYRDFLLLSENENADANELDARNIQLTLNIVSHGLKAGRSWLKFWLWPTYLFKYSTKYIYRHIRAKEIDDIVQEIFLLEGKNPSKEENEKTLPQEISVFSELKVRGFIRKHAGLTSKEIDNMLVPEFFQILKHAIEQFKISMEGGKINLTEDNEMSRDYIEYQKWKEGTPWIKKYGAEA